MNHACSSCQTVRPTLIKVTCCPYRLCSTCLRNHIRACPKPAEPTSWRTSHCSDPATTKTSALPNRPIANVHPFSQSGVDTGEVHVESDGASGGSVPSQSLQRTRRNIFAAAEILASRGYTADQISIPAIRAAVRSHIAGRDDPLHVTFGPSTTLSDNSARTTELEESMQADDGGTAEVVSLRASLVVVSLPDFSLYSLFPNRHLGQALLNKARKPHKSAEKVLVVSGGETSEVYRNTEGKWERRVVSLSTEGGIPCSASQIAPNKYILIFQKRTYTFTYSLITLTGEGGWEEVALPDLGSGQGASFSVFPGTDKSMGALFAGGSDSKGRGTTCRRFVVEEGDENVGAFLKPHPPNFPVWIGEASAGPYDDGVAVVGGYGADNSRIESKAQSRCWALKVRGTGTERRWTELPDLNIPRYRHLLLPTPDGGLLAIGGYGIFLPPTQVEEGLETAEGTMEVLEPGAGAWKLHPLAEQIRRPVAAFY